jgi:AcrR family transcriptional regulator
MPASDVQQLIRVFRREQVVTTALEVFGRAGSLDASMEEIAAEAGVSRSTIYNHFKDRNELLAACADWSYGRLSTAMKESLDREGTPGQLLARFFEAVLSCLDENPGFYRLATTLRSTASEAEAVLDVQLTVASSRIVEQVDRLVARLAATQDMVVDVKVAASLIGVVLAGALQRRATLADPPPAAAAARELADVLLYGLIRR